MSDTSKWLCDSCKHYWRGSFPPRCDAFKLMPMNIVSGEIKHTEPYPGDRGIRYEKGTPHGQDGKKLDPTDNE